MSNTSVKEAIMDLVKGEDSSSPLSDKEIGNPERTRHSDRPPHRRKYAELNILPSNMRRKY